VNDTNRRGFLRKIIALTASAGIAGLLLDRLPGKGVTQPVQGANNDPITVGNPFTGTSTTSLSSSANPALAATNTSNGAALQGTSTAGTGVLGTTTSGTGVQGTASAASGIALSGFAGDPSAIPIVAQGSSGQSANLQEWRGSSGVLSAVDANGDFVLGHDGRYQAKDTGGTARNIMFIGGDNNIYMVNDIPSSLYVIQTGATSRAQFGNPLWLSARGTYTDFFMTSGGNVGIGTAGPGYRLDVAGQVHATGFPTSSDMRFKEDITPVDNALDKVLRLNGVYFKWNQLHREVLKRSNTKTRQVGLIAQQVREVVPEIVSEWADQGAEDYLAVDYNRLVAIMIEAMKEQQTQITEQQSTIEQLLRRIANLEGNNETVHTH